MYRGGTNGFSRVTNLIERRKLQNVRINFDEARTGLLKAKRYLRHAPQLGCRGHAQDHQQRRQRGLY